MRSVAGAIVCVVVIVQLGCATARDAVDAESRVLAQTIWREKAAVIDESLEFWQRQEGVARYSLDELEEAVEFFEKLTGIDGNDISYFGRIPDEDLTVPPKTRPA